MQLINVNIGSEQVVRHKEVTYKTGIHKKPADAPVQVLWGGLLGDSICDPKNHGGVDQAVYIYSVTDYDWWVKELGREIKPGTFGENLTITQMESAKMCAGDRLIIGSVILEVTAPRIPCYKLAEVMGDPSFIKRFKEAERPGVYCRVIQEGFLKPGENVLHEQYSGERVSLLEMFRDHYEPDLSEGAIRRFLAAPIAIRSRMDKEKQLERL